MDCILWHAEWSYNMTDITIIRKRGALDRIDGTRFQLAHNKDCSSCRSYVVLHAALLLTRQLLRMG